MKMEMMEMMEDRERERAERVQERARKLGQAERPRAASKVDGG
jgi:hypothetical protein